MRTYYFEHEQQQDHCRTILEQLLGQYLAEALESGYLIVLEFIFTVELQIESELFVG